MNRQDGLFSAVAQMVAAFSLAHREIVRSLSMGYALSGKTALVTGANRGIGEAIVDALIAAGVKKVYVAARNISARTTRGPPRLPRGAAPARRDQHRADRHCCRDRNGR